MSDNIKSLAEALGFFPSSSDIMRQKKEQMLKDQAPKKSTIGRSTFYQIKEGYQTLRFLVYNSNQDFVKTLHYHTFIPVKDDDKHFTFPCVVRAFPENFKEDACPMCNLLDELSKYLGKELVEKQLSQYYPKARYYSTVLVRGEEDKLAQIIGYSKVVQKLLWQEFMEDDNIFDIENGTDFVLIREGKGKTNTRYYLKPARGQPSPIHPTMNEKFLADLAKSIRNLDEIFIPPSAEYMENNRVISRKFGEYMIDWVTSDIGIKIPYSVLDVLGEFSTEVKPAQTSGTDYEPSEESHTPIKEETLGSGQKKVSITLGNEPIIQKHVTSDEPSVKVSTSQKSSSTNSSSNLKVIELPYDNKPCFTSYIEGHTICNICVHEFDCADAQNALKSGTHRLPDGFVPTSPQ